MFSGVVRDAVWLQFFFFDRAIRSAHPVDKVVFFDGMRGTDCSIEKIWIERPLIRLSKNAPYMVFDRKSPFWVHRYEGIRNWPETKEKTTNSKRNNKGNSNETSRYSVSTNYGKLWAGLFSSISGCFFFVRHLVCLSWDFVFRFFAFPHYPELFSVQYFTCFSTMVHIPPPMTLGLG